MLKTRKKAVLAAAAIGALVTSPLWLPVWFFVLLIRGGGWLIVEGVELVEEAGYYLDLARRYRRWQLIRRRRTPKEPPK